MIRLQPAAPRDPDSSRTYILQHKTRFAHSETRRSCIQECTIRCKTGILTEVGTLGSHVQAICALTKKDRSNLQLLVRIFRKEAILVEQVVYHAGKDLPLPAKQVEFITTSFSSIGR